MKNAASNFDLHTPLEQGINCDFFFFAHLTVLGSIIFSICVSMGLFQSGSAALRRKSLSFTAL
jgi:hypothetical protein